MTPQAAVHLEALREMLASQQRIVQVGEPKYARRKVRIAQDRVEALEWAIKMGGGSQ